MPLSFFADLRAGLAGLAPGRFPYRRFGLAIALGSAGGYVFARLNLPLPWMLGSMAVLTVAALARAPIAAPALVRAPMAAVIGVMLGTNFSPAVIGQVPGWIVTVLGLVVFIVISGALCVLYFRHVGGYDFTTAYFAGMPGGLVEMVMMGDERGGDARAIALIHSARILLIVFTLPFFVQWLEGVSLGPRAQLGTSVLDAPLDTELWLLGTAVFGVALGYLLRLPAKQLLGPMLLSAIVHTAGLSDFKAPQEIVNAAQVVLGAVIGCRFLGTSLRDIARILVLSLGSTLILLAVTFAFGFGLSLLAAHEPVPLILAFSPGGLAEMSLIALAMRLEVAFVAAHHIIRVFFVMAGASLVFGLIVKAKPSPPSHRTDQKP